ncbi:MAG TPA: transposase, partial [Ktedonobacterales bacterium]|nr:transposase [Ktedonobacterales bacterium]
MRPASHDVHAPVLQDVLTRLERAFHAFFRRVQAGETPGSPRFHGANRYDSFTDQQFGDGARLENGCLVLATIRRSAVRWSCAGRALVVRWSRPLEGTPKTVPISQDADGWYAGFSCAGVPLPPGPLTGQDTGLALGLASFASRAAGSPSAIPRSVRRAQRPVQRAHRRVSRRVSRRVKGSHRRRKAGRRLARAHQQVRRARADFQHTVALSLVRQHATIAHEDLQPANLLRNHPLAKSSADAGWSACLSPRAFPAVGAGKRVIAVPPASTRQTCSGGGRIVHKGLCVRWPLCPDCGTSLPRDVNAARNLERLGQRLRGAVAETAAGSRGGD